MLIFGTKPWSCRKCLGSGRCSASTTNSAALGAFENERLELLEGALVEMAPPGPPHSSTVDKLTMLLAPALLQRVGSGESLAPLAFRDVVVRVDAVL